MYSYILAICFVFGLCSLVPAQSNPVDALESQAYIWMQRGRADKAAEVWRKLLISQPQHTTALSELAVHAITVGALEEAQQRFRQLQEADPRDSRLAFVNAMLRTGDKVAAELREARLLSKAGRSKAALRHYRKAFGETEPTTLAGLEYYQVLAASPDGQDAAYSGIERLVELYPKAVHVQLALALHLTCVPSTRTRGIGLLQQLTGVPAVSSEAQAGWRQAVIWFGESPDALPVLQAYVSANPQDNELRRRLELLEPRLAQQKALRQAFKAFEAGELDQAKEKFQSIPGSGRNPEALVGLASIALSRQDFDQAAKLLYKARDLAPQRPELWLRSLRSAELWQEIKRADVLRREGQIDKAQTLLEHATTSDATERYQAVLALSDVQLERGDLSGAQRNLHELLVTPPTETSGLRWLVSLLLRANLNEQASVANEKLREIDPLAAFSPGGLRAEQLRLRAIELRKAGDVIAAHDTLVTAAGLDLRASQVRLDLVNLDLELGDLDEAQRSVDTLLKAEPKLPEVLLVAARLAEQRGEHEQGLKLLGTIASSASSDEIDNLRRRLEVRLATARAVRTFHIGGISAARVQLSKLEQVTPGSTNLAIVAEAWADIGEVDHALLLLHGGEPVSSGVPSVQLQMAALLLRVGRTSEAMAALDEISAQPALAPEELLALQRLRIGCTVRLADSLRSTGDLEGARSVLVPWTETRPFEPQITNAYGRVLHDGGDYVAAAGQYMQVLKRDPGNPDALQGLTYAAMNGGVSLADARHALQQGLKVHGNDPRLHFCIARLDDMAGSYPAALEELTKADRLVENELRPGVTLTTKQKTIASLPSRTRQSEAELEHLRSEIKSELQRVRAAAGIRIKPEIMMRSRQGEPGRQALFELTAPSRLEFPNPWGTLSLQITPTILSAGQLVAEGPDTVFFGTAGGTFGERDIKAEGVALGVEYDNRGWQLDLGVTPLNFARSTIVGALSWKRAFRDITLTLEASRRAVEESVLSFAGISDPGTGSVWGGVVKQGGAVSLRHDDRKSTSYAVLDYKYLTGTNVESNQSLAAHLGIRWELKRNRRMRLETGIAVSAMAFERNLSKFTYGHGGYFSPQRFVHCGLPVDWRGSYRAMTWQMTLEPGVTWFQMDGAPYYPLATGEQISASTARYPSSESLGLGVDGGLELGYVITPQMTLGARAELHTGDDYREISALTFLRFAIRGGDAPSRGD